MNLHLNLNNLPPKDVFTIIFNTLGIWGFLKKPAIGFLEQLLASQLVSRCKYVYAENSVG